MESAELILKCTKGVYVGKFFYLNSIDQEIIGSGSFESNEVTASIQNASLDPAHSKIVYKNNGFYLSDLNTSEGTWVKIAKNKPHIISASSEFKIFQHTFKVSDLSISPASISLTSNQNQQVTGTSHIKISSKQPADYIFGTLSPFSLEISFDTTHYTITPTEGILYYRLFHELLLHPGMEILIGTLNFELSNYNYGKSSAIGMRPTMEDNDCIIQDLHICEQPVSYYAVFDGHGGGECSRFLKVNLHEFLREQLYGVNDIAAWPGLIKQAFFQCDQSFRSSFPELSNFIGSTAVVCLIKFPNLIAINTGDSRAILSRRGDAIQLTNDHKPEVASERERIENAGGTVLCGRVMGKLGLSRAFGDFEFRSPGKEMVISEPEVEFYLINRHIDEFVVLGCDGLFEAYSNQELVKCVKEKLKRMRVTEQDPYRVIKDIVTEAVYARRTGDNITAILVSLSAGLV